jgi:hypothetical protein
MEILKFCDNTWTFYLEDILAHSQQLLWHDTLLSLSDLIAKVNKGSCD